jgi:hypothetical protein
MNRTQAFLVIFDATTITICGALALSLSGQANTVAWIGTAMYAVITLKLTFHFSKEDDFLNKFRLLSSLRDSRIDAEKIALFEKFYDIENPFLERVKKSSFEEFHRNVNQMHQYKRTADLDKWDYIENISNALEGAKSGDKLLALSFYEMGEFDENNPYELNFHKAQMDAVSRGVSITRIFVCTRERINDLKSTSFWGAHFGQIQGYFVDSESAKSLPTRQGFLSFPNIAFIDRLGPDNEIAGFMSAHEADIEQTQKDFRALIRNAVTFEDAFGDDLGS